MENAWGVSGFWECFIHDQSMDHSMLGVPRQGFHGEGCRQVVRADGSSLEVMGWWISWCGQDPPAPWWGKPPGVPSLQVSVFSSAKWHAPCMYVLKSCPTLQDSMDCSLPGSSVHGIFQARRLEWVTIFSSRGSSWLNDWTCISFISCIGRQILSHCATWEAQHSLLVMPIWSWGGLIWPGPGETIKVNFLIGGLQASACQTQRVLGDLGNRQIQIQQVWGGAWDAAFPTLCPENTAGL